MGEVVPEDEEGAFDFVFEVRGLVFYCLEKGFIGVAAGVVWFAIFETRVLGGCSHLAQ